MSWTPGGICLWASWTSGEDPTGSRSFGRQLTPGAGFPHLHDATCSPETEIRAGTGGHGPGRTVW